MKRFMVEQLLGVSTQAIIEEKATAADTKLPPHLHQFLVLASCQFSLFMASRPKGRAIYKSQERMLGSLLRRYPSGYLWNPWLGGSAGTSHPDHLNRKPEADLWLSPVEHLKDINQQLATNTIRHACSRAMYRGFGEESRISIEVLVRSPYRRIIRRQS
jgi:hypothetical protein